MHEGQPSIGVQTNLGEDCSCFSRYLKILFLPTMRLESSGSLLSPNCPEVFAFFSSRLLSLASSGSSRYSLFRTAELAMRKLPGDRLKLFLGGVGSARLCALLLLFSNSLSLPGLPPAGQGERAWKLMPSSSLWMESLLRLLLLWSALLPFSFSARLLLLSALLLAPGLSLKLCRRRLEEVLAGCGCFLSCASESSDSSWSNSALSVRNFSWIFLRTSCLRCSRVLRCRLGASLMIFSISSTKRLKLRSGTSLLIQLVLRSCNAWTMLAKRRESPSELYSMSSVRLPLAKQPLTQLRFQELRRMPWPSKTLLRNSPTQRLPLRNTFSPIPFSCVFTQYPRSTSRSSNSSSCRPVSGLYPPAPPRYTKLNPNPLMNPFFSKPTRMRLPCFCASMSGSLGKSQRMARACVVPTRKSISPSSNTRFSTLKSPSSLFSTMLPRRNYAQITDLVMQFSSTAFPSNSPSVPYARNTRKPSVRQAHSERWFLWQMAERRPQVSKKRLWPWRRSLEQLVRAETPSSWSRMPRPSFLKDLMPPMYMAFLQWQQQSDDVDEPPCAPTPTRDLDGLLLFSAVRFIGDFFILLFYIAYCKLPPNSTDRPTHQLQSRAAIGHGVQMQMEDGDIGHPIYGVLSSQYSGA